MTLTVTTTFTEEEPNGWVYTQPDPSVGIYGGWGHDDPSHEDVWPPVEELAEHGRCGESDERGRVATWEKYECQGCGAILIVLKANQVDQDGDLLW